MDKNVYFQHIEKHEALKIINYALKNYVNYFIQNTTFMPRPKNNFKSFFIFQFIILKLLLHRHCTYEGIIHELFLTRIAIYSKKQLQYFLILL